MALDDYLKNTMAGTSPMPTPSAPTLSGNTDQDIKTLEGKYNPGGLGNFTTLMQNVARSIYSDRQKSEVASAQGQIGDAKVSGNTFAGILGFLEKNRGESISKVYGSTMDAYKQSQAQIREDLYRLRDEKQRQKERIQNLMADAPGADIKESDSWAVAVAKMKKYEAKLNKEKKAEKAADKEVSSAQKSQSAMEKLQKDYGNDMDSAISRVKSGSSNREEENARLTAKYGQSYEGDIYRKLPDGYTVKGSSSKSY